MVAGHPKWEEEGVARKIAWESLANDGNLNHEDRLGCPRTKVEREKW